MYDVRLAPDSSLVRQVFRLSLHPAALPSILLSVADDPRHLDQLQMIRALTVSHLDTSGYVFE